MRILFLSCFFLSTLLLSAQEKPAILNDSAMDLYKQDPQKAIALLERAIELSDKEKDDYHIAKSRNNLGIVYRTLGRYKEAKELSTSALSVSDSVVMASAYNNLGVINRNLALYDESITNYLKALDIYEKKELTRERATVLNSIGMVYSYNGINEKAIEYHEKAKDMFERINNKKGISEVYNNIAIIYANDGDLETALAYFKYSLEIEEELEDQKGIAESVNNVGAVYYYLGDIDAALEYFNRSLNIEKRIGDEGGIAASYNNIANVRIENSRLNGTRDLIDSAMYYAERSKVAVDVESALDNYAKYYEAKDDSKTALRYFKDLIVFRDSILNIETNEKIAKLEIEYQTEKKEKEILSQRADLAEQKLELNEKNTQLLGLVILAVVLSLLGYLFYNQQRLKNRQLKKESQLKEALSKIETQNRLQDQRLRISRDLHDNIGAQLTFIISSLDNLKYGFKLQEKLSDKLSSISEFTSTTINELRDTIWAMNKTDISIEDLQSRISNYIEKADASSEPVSFSFSTNIELLDKVKLSSVQGMNVYRIIQEAINNAMKYSEATEIKVDLNAQDSGLVVLISDNGSGFDQETVNLGNGIQNMKKRALEIDAELSLSSKLDEGTQIRLELINFKNTTNDV